MSKNTSSLMCGLVGGMSDVITYSWLSEVSL
jgi:hypothetical protein